MTYTSPTNTRREWILDHDPTPVYWTIGRCPCRPISLDTLVNIGAVLNVDGVPYPCGDWMTGAWRELAEAWRELADAKDQRDTYDDAFGPAVQ